MRQSRFPVVRGLKALVVLAALVGCGGDPGGPPIVGSLSVVPDTGTLTFIGQVFSVEAAVRDTDGNALGAAVTWTSSAAGVATVSNGDITATGPGVATITATASGVSGSATITVAPRAAAVSIAPLVASVEVGSAVTLTLTAVDAGDTPIANAVGSWTSSDSGVATVSTTGVVTGRAPGTVTISATVDGVTGQSEVTVNAAG